MITKLCAYKLWQDCLKEGLQVSKAFCVSESAMAANQIMVVDNTGHTPCEALLGFSPRHEYTPESDTLDSWQSALDTTPDPMETILRSRMAVKANILKAVVEERIARANNTKVQQHDLREFILNQTPVDIYRVPANKDDVGWRGPCEIVHISSDNSTAIVIHQSQAYILPMQASSARSILLSSLKLMISDG